MCRAYYAQSLEQDDSSSSLSYSRDNTAKTLAQLAGCGRESMSIRAPASHTVQIRDDGDDATLKLLHRVATPYGYVPLITAAVIFCLLVRCFVVMNSATEVPAPL